MNIQPTNKQRITGAALPNFNWNLRQLDRADQFLEDPLFQTIKEVGRELNQPVYLIGGWVRDLIMNRPSKDIDVVTVGSGIDLAEALAQRYRNTHVNVYRQFGTAQLKLHNFELEFVGARKESYRSNSRNPIVENGTLEDDQKRRDFTVNAISISLNSIDFGTIIDPFNGIQDLKNSTLRTPLQPEQTFKDDPLRMMRAIRFSSQLGFDVVPDAYEAIKRNAQRLKIVAPERITDEFNKILLSPKPSIGLVQLFNTGLLEQFLPELIELHGVEHIKGQQHKDNFYHTLEVVDNIAPETDNLYLIYAALFHDIAKPRTKHFDSKVGFSFHGHEYVGSKMIPKIFRRMKLPLNEKMRYVQKLVAMSSRPAALVSEEATDSGVRRMVFEAGEATEDLMTLCEADITTKNAKRMMNILDNYKRVRQRIEEVEEKDSIRNFQPPVDGGEIMRYFKLDPGPLVGELKHLVKEAILEGEINNTREEAWQYLQKEAEKRGLTRE